MSTPPEPRRSLRRPRTPRRAAHRASRRPPADLRVSVEQHATVALLRVSGEFDLAGVDRVERAVAMAVDPVTDHVVFDLRDVSFLDVCALETILRTDARAHSESFAVEVVPPRGRAARIFALTETDRQLTLVDGPPR